MSKLSKKQEKKRQLRQRERQSKDPAGLAYYGNKYRTEALVAPLMQTEAAILESYVVMNRRLTDHDVCRALATLVDHLRRGTALTPKTAGAVHLTTDDRSEVIVRLVHLRWLSLPDGHPGRDNLIGIVRTILGSVERHKSVSPQSRNYLEFIEGFLGKLGVRVQCAPESMFAEAESAGRPPALPR